MKNLWGLLVILLLSGVASAENQTNLSANLFAIANPRPTDRDFLTNNSNHKILVAVIDSGVDYNHPNLLKNMHFHLDSNNQPDALGWDFMGEDVWPAPYLVRTESLPTQNSKNIQQALQVFPQLAEDILPERLLEQEVYLGVSHGTHVTGILAGQDEAIGILPYKIDNEKLLPQRFKDFLDAHDKAIQDGARVINLSQGFKIGTLAKDRFQKIKTKYQDYVLNHPDILFIAASGNDGTNVGDQFPCGIRAPNIICVGSVNYENNKSDFSNTTSDQNFVFANGEEVFSAIATHSCRASILVSDNLDLSQNPKDFMRYCHNNLLGDMSGTSMATPVVSHIAAEILIQNPNLEPTGVIQKILEIADAKKLGLVSAKEIQ